MWPGGRSSVHGQAIRLQLLVFDFSFTSIHQNMSSQTRTLPFSTDGRLFSWGQNSRSQLGHSSDSSSISTPCVIKALEGVPVTQIATGGRHCFVLSVSGAVYGWGKNE